MNSCKSLFPEPRTGSREAICSDSLSKRAGVSPPKVERVEFTYTNTKLLFLGYIVLFSFLVVAVAALTILAFQLMDGITFTVIYDADWNSLERAPPKWPPPACRCVECEIF